MNECCQSPRRAPDALLVCFSQVVTTCSLTTRSLMVKALGRQRFAQGPTPSPHQTLARKTCILPSPASIFMACTPQEVTGKEQGVCVTAKAKRFQQPTRVQGLRCV